MHANVSVSLAWGYMTTSPSSTHTIFKYQMNRRVVISRPRRFSRQASRRFKFSSDTSILTTNGACAAKFCVINQYQFYRACMGSSTEVDVTSAYHHCFMAAAMLAIINMDGLIIINILAKLPKILNTSNDITG